MLLTKLETRVFAVDRVNKDNDKKTQFLFLAFFSIIVGSLPSKKKEICLWNFAKSVIEFELELEFSVRTTYLFVWVIDQVSLQICLHCILFFSESKHILPGRFRHWWNVWYRSEQVLPYQIPH